MDWCTGNTTYDTWLTVALAYALFAGVASIFIPSPYGRFASTRFGISMSPRLGWFLMELPALPIFAFFYFTGARWTDPVPLLFGGVWLIHYANRGYLFPYLIRTVPGKRTTFSLLVVVAGWGATSLHGYLNAAFLVTYGTHFGTDWLTDPSVRSGHRAVLRRLRPDPPRRGHPAEPTHPGRARRRRKCLSNSPGWPLSVGHQSLLSHRAAGLGGRSPKMAVPTRTRVAPSSTATAKS